MLRFQSTPSGGKATESPFPIHAGLFVSIHAFRGEGDRAAPQDAAPRAVSIHAFRGEGDGSTSNTSRVGFGFQSTPSGGKATTARAM